jgi:hypothetical protein
MNERMLELYRQADVPHTAIDPSNNMPYQTTTFSAEKFAELIVTKCAVIATRCESNGNKNIGAEILEHFGVEDK